jgi:hypothetical protein
VAKQTELRLVPGGGPCSRDEPKVTGQECRTLSGPAYDIDHIVLWRNDGELADSLVGGGAVDIVSEDFIADTRDGHSRRSARHCPRP